MGSGSVIALCLIPFFGYCYDIVGRFWLIVPSCFLVCIFMVLTPYAAPQIWLLIIFRAFISVLIRLVMMKPLLIDYVKSKSRGFGMTF